MFNNTTFDVEHDGHADPHALHDGGGQGENLKDKA